MPSDLTLPDIRPYSIRPGTVPIEVTTDDAPSAATAGAVAIGDPALLDVTTAYNLPQWEPVVFGASGLRLASLAGTMPQFTTYVGRALPAIRFVSDPGVYAPVATFKGLCLLVPLPDEAATTPEPSEKERQEAAGYNEAREILAGLFSYYTDAGELFDGRALMTALRVLKFLEAEGMPPPRLAWHGGDAIDFSWRADGRLMVLTISDGSIAVLPGGRFDPKLSDIRSEDSGRLIALLRDAIE